MIPNLDYVTGYKIGDILYNVRVYSGARLPLWRVNTQTHEIIVFDPDKIGGIDHVLREAERQYRK